MTALHKWIVFLSALLLVSVATNSAAQSLDRIVGAWNYGAVGCTTCLDGMFSISPGGQVVGYDNTPRTSPNIGTWRAIDRSTFRMRTKNAVYNSDGTVNVFIQTAGTLGATRF